MKGRILIRALATVIIVVAVIGCSKLKSPIAPVANQTDEVAIASNVVEPDAVWRRFEGILINKGVTPPVPLADTWLFWKVGDENRRWITFPNGLIRVDFGSNDPQGSYKIDVVGYTDFYVYYDGKQGWTDLGYVYVWPYLEE